MVRGKGFEKLTKEQKIEIRGLEELQRDLEKAAQKLPPGLERVMGKATLVVERRAKKIVVVDTGRLRASIAPEVKRIGGDVRGIVGSNVVYAPYVERGTRRMKARPYLSKAVQEKEKTILKILDKFTGVIVKIIAEE